MTQRNCDGTKISNDLIFSRGKPLRSMPVHEAMASNEALAVEAIDPYHHGEVVRKECFKHVSTIPWARVDLPHDE